VNIYLSTMFFFIQEIWFYSDFLKPSGKIFLLQIVQTQYCNRCGDCLFPFDCLNTLY
jgi:hypothetical protein